MNSRDEDSEGNSENIAMNGLRTYGMKRERGVQEPKTTFEYSKILMI